MADRIPDYAAWLIDRYECPVCYFVRRALLVREAEYCFFFPRALPIELKGIAV